MAVRLLYSYILIIVYVFLPAALGFDCSAVDRLTNDLWVERLGVMPLALPLWGASFRPKPTLWIEKLGARPYLGLRRFVFITKSTRTTSSCVNLSYEGLPQPN